jgi:hypothetical protein
MLVHYNNKMTNYSNTVSQHQNKELFDMVSEIANYCKNRTIEGIATKIKLTNTGGKYKWSDGQEITFICGNVEFVSGFVSFYEDTNSYKQKDLLVDTNYFFNIHSRNIDLNTYVERFAYLKAKLRKIRIHNLLNSK